MQNSLYVGFIVLGGGLVLLIGKEGRGDKHIGRGAVDGSRYIVEGRQAKQCLDIHVVGLCLHGVPEEDEGRNLTLGNHRAELLVATKRTRFEEGDIEVIATLVVAFHQCSCDHLTCRACAYEMMAEQ